jgi:thiamine biosynthesis lipoprotein
VYRAKTLFLIWLLLPLLLLGGCDRRSHLVEQHLLEFGTIIQITLITDDLQLAERLLREIEARLRNFRGQWHAWEDSDLTRFNAALRRDGRARVPDSLAELLALSRAYQDASGGLFNPALGKLIAAYGFHGSDGDPAVIAEVRRNMPSMQDLQIDGDLARSSNPHLQIDLGGIAKGYALGLIAKLLDRNGIRDYIVNAGGDMQIAGSRFGRPWRIGVQNPFAPGMVASLEIEGRHSLFTSGNYYRRYRRGDQSSHHIIDPRRGESSRGQSSATVLASDPVRADVAATVLMIDGLGNSRELALSLGVENYLVIGDSRQIRVTAPFAEKLAIVSDWDVEIIN